MNNMADKKPNKKISAKPKQMAIYGGLSVLLLLVATGTGYLFGSLGISETNIVIVYLLAVLGTASLTKGYVYGIATAVAATFAFNFFFTVPLYTFAVDDPSYLITFAVMTVTSTITSTLTTKIKQNAENARIKEEEAKALYNLTNRLTDAKALDEIACIGLRTVSETFGCNAAILFFGEPLLCIIQIGGEQKHAEIDDKEILKRKAEWNRNGETEGAEYLDYTIYGRESVFGLLRVPKEIAKEFNDVQKRLLHSMIENLSLATDSFLSKESQTKAREEAEKEKYRSNLLRAISHDIRTPLSGIMGTAEMLVNMTPVGDERHKLAEEINSDADWLHSLVENILSLTRLKDGDISIDKKPEALEEVIGSAVDRIKKRHPQCMISVTSPDNPVFVPMDAKLIEQVILNLLDNAVKYAGEEANIQISFGRITHEAVVSIEDNGPGMQIKEIPNLFKLFYKGKTGGSAGKKGVGLGLAICKTVIAAHGGKISAENRMDTSGAIFHFSLPLEDKNV